MTRAGGLLCCVLALVLGLPSGAWAQQARDRTAPATTPARAEREPAILVADDVFLNGDDQLVATGNVEALHQGRRLKARQVVYDRRTERLTVTGPITIEEADGAILILADSAEMDRDLTDGLLRGARIVMEDQIQLAAHEMARVNGRYNQLFQAAVTSCRICDDGRPPLWQIRARRVIHDQAERQLYFQDAQLRVFDTPIFYLPRLRMPDPTLERATGFLVPSLHNSSLLGFGARVPYFVRLGDHKDLTITPFVSTEALALELRYRQAFRNGQIEFNTAVARDDIGKRETRAYLFGDGRFDLRRDFVLRFHIEAVNDDTFLLDYDFSNKDRLDSQIEIERARRNEYIRGALTAFRTLREGESNSTLPTAAIDGEYERRLPLKNALGGELRLGVSTHAHYRSSGLNVDGPDFDPWADGRDMARLSLHGEWHRNWVLPTGVLVHTQAGLAVDTFGVNQAGMTSASQASEATPNVAAELRWPLTKTTASGTAHVIEPVAMLAWAGGDNPDIPNDESTRIEFDEGNLFSTSRFTAPDRRERGFSAAYGLQWTRYGKLGWQHALAVGQVFRDDRLTEPDGTPSFTNSSGLQDRLSDLLVAFQLRNDDGLTLTARGLFDEDLQTTKAETRASWRNARADIAATYIWLRRDPAEERPDNVSEWAFDARYRLSKHWTGQADWRFDVASEESVRAGVGLTYTNECVDITLSASRRFTSSTILSPSTDIRFIVNLRGFTTKTRDKSYMRTCEN